jgi:hypothetical protein
MSISTLLLVAVIAIVSSGMLFVILRWMGIIGTKVVAKVEDEKSKLPR